MSAMWTVCRIVAVTLLAAVLVGGALDLTASEFVDGIVFLAAVGFFLIGLVGAAVCLGLIVSLCLEAWKANR